DLRFGRRMVQNYNNVILGESGAPFHALAGTSPMQGVRPRSVLSREGWIFPGGQAHLRGVSRPDRMPELRASPRRAVRRVGRHERTGTPAPQAHGVMTHRVQGTGGSVSAPSE